MPARSCNCSGPCGPQYKGEDGDNAKGDESLVSRRDFIALAGGGAAACAVLTPTAGAGLISLGARPARVQTPPRAEDAAKKLADWKRALHAPDTPRRYESGVHSDVRFPLGGIGTGNIELGADGQFISWQLFNTLRDGYVPFFWGVRAGKTAKLLQTTGGPPNWPAIQKCEMVGEYPIADLTFHDADLPVQVALTTWTPFAPFDEEFSSRPVACFSFRVTNPTRQKQTVSIGGFLQNPTGYDALGSAAFNTARLDNKHPNYGGNFNTLHHPKSEPAEVGDPPPFECTTLYLQAVPPQPSSSSFGLGGSLYTNLDANALNRFPFERSKDSLVSSLDALDAVKVRPEYVTIWIESAPLDLHESVLRRVRDLVNEGAALVWTGKSAPLLDACADTAKNTTKLLSPDVVFEDFENGYGTNWTVEGTAFGTAPAKGTLPGQQSVTGFDGGGLVNSFVNGDQSTGRLTSKPFVIAHNYLRFLVGGGNHLKTQVRLIVNGKTVRAQSGQNNERLLPVVWDIRDLQNQTAHIEIVDEETGPWGHINADHFVFSDSPVSQTVLSLAVELLPGAEEATLPDADGGFRYTRRAQNKGKVIRVFGSPLPDGAAEMWGARQQAFETLRAVVEFGNWVGGNSPIHGLPGTGTMALGTNASQWQALTAFTDWGAAWRWFAENDLGAPSPASADVESKPSPRGQTVNGALSATVDLAPGETKSVEFVLSWHYPNYYNDKNEFIGTAYTTRVPASDFRGTPPFWPDARVAAEKSLRDFADLRERTETFRQTFYAGTLPYWLKDCLTSQISTLRHAGVVFSSNYGLYGWEGSNGCCPPTCTHVWGYEQTLAYLFPTLEQGMRTIDLFHQQNPNGGVNNRTEVPVKATPSGEHPFADGHASTILKAYREIRNQTGDHLMPYYWPRVKAAVDYLLAEDAAQSPDKKPSGVLRGDQWNTYDNAIHGVNSFIGSYYLAALRAGEEMARKMNALGDAARFHEVFEKGQKRLIEECWNGEYFHQNLPGDEKRAGEYGPGCLSDQLIGQWSAHQLDLGYLFPPEMVKTALGSIFRYNWLPDHSRFKHNWRKFAGGNDKGLLICTWPKGGRPKETIPYVDEVWTGVEYQVAAHMIYEGMTNEAFALVKGARDRYDGVPRAPMPRNTWSEIECGGHYARAMSSWSLLLALSGFACDGPNAHIRFAPRHTPEAFASFFTGPEGWGSIKQTRGGTKNKTQTNEIAVVEGRLRIARLSLTHASPVRKASVTLDEKPIKATIKSRTESGEVELHFGSKVTVNANETLSVRLSS